MSQQILSTKLFVVRPQANLVAREHLLRKLDEIPRRRLTLVSASAGFGKTTTIATWIEAHDIPVAWVSLDGGDNEPNRFMTYLVAALGLPYQDRVFQQADAFLGFDWGAWRAFVEARPWFFALQSISYNSSIIQPFVLIPILAWLMPQGRNAELLAAILLALTVTILVSSTCPAQGPAYYAGIETNYDTLLPAIRGSSDAPLPYNGIIWFPSFHTVMGILFTWALRGRRWLFSLFATNNLIMALA